MTTSRERFIEWAIEELGHADTGADGEFCDVAVCAAWMAWEYVAKAQANLADAARPVDDRAILIDFIRYYRTTDHGGESWEMIVRNYCATDSYKTLRAAPARQAGDSELVDWLKQNHSGVLTAFHLSREKKG